MRRFEHPDPAASAQRGGARHVRQRRGRVDEAPIRFLEDPSHRYRNDGQDRGPDRPDHPEADKQVEQQKPGHQRQGKIVRHGPAVAPLVDRLQRGIDHPGAVDRRGRQRRREDPAQAEKAPDDIKKNPADPEDRRRDRGRDRQHALARQPGRAPLREGAPGALGASEVEDRRDQPAGREYEGGPKTGETEQRIGRQQRDRHAEPEQEQEAKTGTGGGREEDDREGGVHVRSDFQTGIKNRSPGESRDLCPRVPSGSKVDPGLHRGCAYHGVIIATAAGRPSATDRWSG